MSKDEEWHTWDANLTGGEDEQESAILTLARRQTVALESLAASIKAIADVVVKEFGVKLTCNRCAHSIWSTMLRVGERCAREACEGYLDAG